MWAHILRDQLQVSEQEFWACVRDGAPPGRGATEAPVEALPAELVYLLVNRVGLPESEVGAMAKEAAVARLQQFWMNGE